jgi:tRNA (guanine-N(7)-)-methyltransferase subunit TRM82
MPKRPSAISVSPDSQIICADKFGDVYALPLIMSSSPTTKPVQPANTPKPLQRPSATVLTVHSKGNRSALANQERQLANKDKPTQGTPRNEVPAFELTLLLGHVSMLTALLVAENDGRRYILTSDRDEHIRVSRYIPQAHVIEGYCLGHKQFIGDMAIPPSNKKLLISGGGDEDLYIWDWLSGKLLSTTSVLSAAKSMAPTTTHVAVSGLYTLEYPIEGRTETFVLAICEK